MYFMKINENTRTYSCETVTKVPATNKMSLTKNRLPKYNYSQCIKCT